MGETASSKPTFRVAPPAPMGFDALTATDKELVKHGIPPRPDPELQPERAALWERYARRYRYFDHLEPVLTPADIPPLKPGIARASLPSDVSCGYELISSEATPFVLLAATWTVPNLVFVPGFAEPNRFHTFVALGFDIDVHVEMTVDSNNTATAQVVVNGDHEVALAVSPGDAITATLCLNDDNPAAATAFCGLANETTAQRVNFSLTGSGFPATRISAGVGRAFLLPPGSNPLAQFGVVYFDELAAYTTGGQRVLTSGAAVSMIDEPGNGATLARPIRMNDWAFKIIPE